MPTERIYVLHGPKKTVVFLYVIFLYLRRSVFSARYKLNLHVQFRFMPVLKIFVC